MLDSYYLQEKERANLGIPSLPLNPAETAEVCAFLEKAAGPEAESALVLLCERVSPGVDPAAKVKAEWLARVAKAEVKSALVGRTDAVFMLGTMLGGYNVGPLVGYLEDPDLGAAAAEALKPGGRLWLVANRHLPYEQTLNERFGEVRVAGERDGFKVIAAIKARR